MFRVPGGGAEWFARALCREGIAARNLGSATDSNVRAFWNWRFLVGAGRAARLRTGSPSPPVPREAVDVPLSAKLTRRTATS